MMLPASFLLLFLVGLGLQLLVQARQSSQQLRRRVNAALDLQERVKIVDLSARNELATRAVDEAPSLASRVFGFNAKRLDLYPLAPVVVIVIALPVALLGGAITTLLLGKAGFLLAIPFWPMTTRAAFGRWQNKRTTVLFEQLPDALAMVVRGVRVGIPVGEAIGSVTRDSPPPTATEFGRVAEQLAIGTGLDDALRAMAERNGLPEYRFFATALSLQSQTGGNLSETLDGLADTIRKRVAARARGYALAAEARTSANVLTVLPVLMFFGLWFMNPRYAMSLLTEQTGHLILGCLIVLLGLGTLSMRFMIRKSLS